VDEGFGPATNSTCATPGKAPARGAQVADELLGEAKLIDQKGAVDHSDCALVRSGSKKILNLDHQPAQLPLAEIGPG
jgi:hypothetical protein